LHILYTILKPIVQLALKLFCRKVFVKNKHLLNCKGPAIIIANHPNSFLDAILLCSLFKQPVHSLARGDAFKKPILKFFLQKLLMLPIYRMSEGKENLHFNNETFMACKQILANSGIVLVFIEGICKQQYGLQPFKKGTARILWEALQNKQHINVITAALQYNSFTSIGKKVHIGLNSFAISQAQFCSSNFVQFANNLHHTIQELLQKQLIQTNHFTVAQKILSKANNYVGFVAENEIELYSKSNKNNIATTTEIKLYAALLFPFYILSLLAHAPLYYLIKMVIKKLTKGTVFYDSVLLGSLLLFYPMYVICAIIVLSFFCNGYLLLYAIAPLLAMFAIYYKQELLQQQ
jgi:1-acyl-sn-glycerol-3-phosphate acyltransferase